MYGASVFEPSRLHLLIGVQIQGLWHALLVKVEVPSSYPYYPVWSSYLTWTSWFEILCFFQSIHFCDLLVGWEGECTAYFLANGGWSMFLWYKCMGSLLDGGSLRFISLLVSDELNPPTKLVWCKLLHPFPSELHCPHCCWCTSSWGVAPGRARVLWVL